jgi:hypothetical protein
MLFLDKPVAILAKPALPHRRPPKVPFRWIVGAPFLESLPAKIRVPVPRFGPQLVIASNQSQNFWVPIEEAEETLAGRGRRRPRPYPVCTGSDFKKGKKKKRKSFLCLFLFLFLFPASPRLLETTQHSLPLCAENYRRRLNT